jgi:hypothetical protein
MKNVDCEIIDEMKDDIKIRTPHELNAYHY